MISKEDARQVLRLSWLWRRAGPSWTSVGDVRDQAQLTRQVADELVAFGVRMGAFEVSDGKFYRVVGGRAANAAKDQAIRAMLWLGPTPRRCLFDHYQHPIDTRLKTLSDRREIVPLSDNKGLRYMTPGDDPNRRDVVEVQTVERGRVVTLRVGDVDVLELFGDNSRNGGYVLTSSRPPWSNADHFIGQIKSLQSWQYALRTSAAIHGAF